jgi:DNA-binding SARP family transcriptional activator
LEVLVAGGEPVALVSAQQRALLALLVVSTPEPVTRDRLIDELWGENPPASAHHGVQVYVSGVRKVWRAAGSDAEVRSSKAGYALAVEPEQVGARRLERLVGEARRALADDPGLAWERFVEALSLRRGPPLAGFEDVELARREAERLDELRVLASDGLVQARLECAEHAEVIGQITGLLGGNPLRERPRRLLMLALYRSGRHAEALSAYHDACAALDEIGLHPGPELRTLEQAILRHDESLSPGNGPVGALGRGSEPGREAGAEYGVNANRLPTSGEVALLFTDIERSTQLLNRLGELCTGVLAEHHRVMREAVEATGGYETGTAGDSFFVAFETVTAPMRSPAAHGHRHERDRQVRTSAGARLSYIVVEGRAVGRRLQRSRCSSRGALPAHDRREHGADAPPSICGLDERAGRPRGSRPANTIRHMRRTYASSSSWSDLKSVSRL